MRSRQGARGVKIHSLNIGQPDIQTPSVYFDALADYREDVLAYAPSPGIPVLLEAVQRYYARIGVEFSTSDILITTGGSEALLMTMMAILDEGSEVIVPEPFYPNYNTFIRLAGGAIRPVPATPEDGYRYAERSRIEPLINERTRAILITNPGNPTGTVLTPEELRTVADIAREHGLYLICDEVYREFIYDGGRLTSAARLRDIDENLILIDSVSKRFQRLRRAHRRAAQPEYGVHGGRAEDRAGAPVRCDARPSRRGRALRGRPVLFRRDPRGIPAPPRRLLSQALRDPRRRDRRAEGRVLYHGEAPGRQRRGVPDVSAQ